MKFLFEVFSFLMALIGLLFMISYINGDFAMYDGENIVASDKFYERIKND